MLSAILFLILPGVGIPMIAVMIATFITRSESKRSLIAVTGMAAALAVGISLNKLIPFDEIETGWRSLFWATLASMVIERLIVIVLPKETQPYWRSLAFMAVAIGSSLWLTPWESTTSRPLICASLAIGAFLNWSTLDLLAERKTGFALPLLLAFIWCGSAATVIVLSHSARFAELAILMSCVLAGIGMVTVMTRQSRNHIYAGPSVFIPGLVLASALNTYSSIPNLSFALVAVLPATLMVLRFKKLSDWFATHPKLLLTYSVVPAVIAIGLALRSWATEGF